MSPESSSAVAFTNAPMARIGHLFQLPPQIVPSHVIWWGWTLMPTARDVLLTSPQSRVTASASLCKGTKSKPLGEGEAAN